MSTTQPEWRPDPASFLLDLEAKPAALDELAGSLDVAFAIGAISSHYRRVLFLGMGSSRFAAEVAARRMRTHGIDAIAEYASARTTLPPAADLLVVGISASGSSKETVSALERYKRRAFSVAITQETESDLATMADVVIPLEAGPEAGGLACRSFQHTGLVLTRLETALTRTPIDFVGLCRRVAMATSDLLDRRPQWLDETAATLDGPDGVHIMAPAERWSSAAQSALMLREGPRRVATASETGDWNHVDVYLTKTTDYRALILTGSAFDEEAMTWLRQRGSIAVAVGGALDGARGMIRYLGDEDGLVALHTETLIAELLAATWWLGAAD